MIRSQRTHVLRPRHTAPRAYTIIEFLVCFAVILILTGILLPALASGRSAARDATCKSNLNRLWVATTYYANSHNGNLFDNLSTPLRISNVIYTDLERTGWGILHPRYMEDYHIFFCPSDPGRNPEWQYGWSNWDTANGEVQCSYGYRGRQGITSDPGGAFSISLLDKRPGKVFGCDFYEPAASSPTYRKQARPSVATADPVTGAMPTPGAQAETEGGSVPAPQLRVSAGQPRTHHSSHTNVLRCNGQVEQVHTIVSFGPTDADVQAALDALDR
jgi:competence protein ComGC